MSLHIFDLDGTLIEGHVERPDPKGPFVQVRPFLDVVVRPNVREVLDAIRAEGVQIAIATNKAGVGFGHHTIRDCATKRAAVLHDLGLPVATRWYEAYGHPRADLPQYRFDDFMRKPNPGMLLQACIDARVEPADATMIGDMDADALAAERAGCDFVWEEDYFDARS